MATALTLEAALQTLRESPPERDNYMKVNFGSQVLVVPHEAGKLMVESLRNAEILVAHTWGSEIQGIFPFPIDAVMFTPFSRKDYERYKIAMLMGIKYEEVVKAEKEALNAQS